MLIADGHSVTASEINNNLVIDLKIGQGVISYAEDHCEKRYSEHHYFGVDVFFGALFFCAFSGGYSVKCC
jgi:hypothetical protein